MDTKLSVSQSQAVQTFISFTGSSKAQAINFLNAAAWSIEEASDAYFENPPPPELDEASISTVFLKYAEEVKEEDETVLLIKSQKLHRFLVTLGVDPETDVASLIVPWKFRCKTPLVITKDEFFAGFKLLNVDNMPALKEKIHSINNELHDDLVFRDMYQFLFVYLLGLETKGKKRISITNAIPIWKLMLSDKFNNFIDDWIQYCEETLKGVGQDCWNLVPDFGKSWKRGTYDPNDAWPVVFDSFLEWYNEKKKNKEKQEIKK